MADYHDGEVTVQRRARLAEQARFSLGGIGETVPEVAAAFLAEQPMIVLGGADGAGRIWATQLTGEPGFLKVPDPRTLTIDALPGHTDPLGELRERPSPVGMIAIEPATRRRMRINGRAVPTGEGLRVDLDQVIANCPKYLQKRRHRFLDPGAGGTAAGPGPVTDGTTLTPAQRETIRRADTFFVATASDRGDADASHRGGNPGFVRVLSPTVLRWPDYTGNAMFLTLGNLELNPAAGLLFPGWDTGTALHLTGTARTVWSPAPGEDPFPPGVRRLVEFTVAAVREVARATPLRWSEPAFSRFNPPVA
ncbi:pyridoxamine 5'-phosphate oxidase family protein [Streptomyces alkaliphilus]|uniref:pyridoxamine 5'-phosphate oxidase family protein n=1 Tax=Streptomyces alkaliphilus TaxID=1472722 RepID=UPI00117C04AF|nr:pyridoxamine 5'-phosphate oxidase family protein [Streptomyces alkaliphilus]